MWKCSMAPEKGICSGLLTQSYLTGNRPGLVNKTHPSNATNDSVCCWSSLANSSLGSLASLGLLCPANLMRAYCYGEWRVRCK